MGRRPGAGSPPQCSGRHAAQPSLAGLRLVPVPGVQLCACTAANVNELQTLIMSVLPVRYPKSFYKSILSDPRLCRYARSDGRLVAAIVLQREGGKRRQPPSDMTVMLICVLAAYRRQGIGSLLLADMAETVCNEPDLAAGVEGLGLHVHVANSEARAFYGAIGFRSVERVEGYFPHLLPPDGLKLRLEL